MRVTRVAVVAPGAVLVAAAWVGLPYFPNGLFEDDAYFYLQIARNMAEGQGSTFDGIATTNGYHPVWMAVLVLAGTPLAWAGVTSASAWGAAFAAVAGGVWARLLAHLRGPALGLGAVLAFYCGLGMESALAAWVLIELFRRVLAGRDPAPWAALLTAVRPDLVVALLPLLAVGTRRRKLRLLIAAGLGLVSVAGYHWLLTGHPYAVSAMIKFRAAATGTMAGAVQQNLSSVGNWYRYGVLATLDAWLAACLLTGRWPRLAGGPRTGWALLLSAQAFLLLHTLSYGVRHYYFAPSLLPALYLLVRSGRPRPSSAASAPAGRWAGACLVLLAVAGAGLYGAYLTRTAADMRANRDFVDRVRTVVPAGSTVYAFDGSGYLGWSLHGHLRVINGDGLVNSFAYYRAAVEEQNLTAYLIAHRVNYCITNHRPPEFDPGLLSLGQQWRCEPVLASASDLPMAGYSLYRVSPRR
jgi:hypothetical protein